MKRNLLENIKAVPYSTGTAVDRLGFLSAVLGINIATVDANAIATVTVTDCDTENGTFEAVSDTRIFLDETVVTRDSEGRFIKSSVSVPVSASELVNIDIDLVGCKQYVKVAVDYAANGAAATASATYVLSLGDSGSTPVNI